MITEKQEEFWVVIFLANKHSKRVETHIVKAKNKRKQPRIEFLARKIGNWIYNNNLRTKAERKPQLVLVATAKFWV